MTEPRRFTEPATDPWKGLRGVMSGILILEAIVVGLAFPIVAKIAGGVTWMSGGYLGLLFIALILACGVQKRPQALQIDLGLQVLVILGGFFHWSIAVIGVIFGCVWIYIVYVKRDVEKRIERGMLAGQEPIEE
ncbi:DUF4233 domain-containing protein [Gordonia soli]|uniref:DUF4233 domain-containing protein n=1 Tax=Gordonia soli NBRC 108243 TaxID=1223545 RepID=M0QKR5_9ACTN|nr:DUF4233 domain-containing protein [Gordonia soli]GAC69039.1 hypothetical protein GS4_20_01040 [Gordonia soli NBRC 108243]